MCGRLEPGPVAGEVRKRPQMALAHFLSQGKRREGTGSSDTLLPVTCTSLHFFIDRLSHSMSEYRLHTHSYRHIRLHMRSEHMHTVTYALTCSSETEKSYRLHFFCPSKEQEENDVGDDDDEGSFATQEVVALGWGSSPVHCSEVKAEK